MSVPLDNVTSCPLQAPFAPPTIAPACAVTNIGNNTALLQSCCGGRQTSSYTGQQNGGCYSYCNLTSNDLRPDDPTFVCLKNGPLVESSRYIQCYGSQLKSGGENVRVSGLLLLGLLAAGVFASA
jgi:hypothetical protein